MVANLPPPEPKNVIFIIDDFDLIDESSYGFLKHLVNADYFERNAKLILGYKHQHSISMYFQTNKLNTMQTTLKMQAT